MSEHTQQITELAELMNEFQLTDARLQIGDFSIAFRRMPKTKAQSLVAPLAPVTHDTAVEVEEVAPVEEAPVTKGIPVSSPMTGIYYGSPNPSSPPFVKIGDEVIAGQTIGLIEAMKVFNEIPSPVSGVVQNLSANSGDLVQIGDVLMHIGG